MGPIIMSAPTFIRRWIGILALTIGFIAIFPYLIIAIVSQSGCRGVGGACGAVTLMAGLYLRFPVIAVLVIALGHACFRRVRYLHLGWPWVLFSCVMLIGAMPFLLAARNFWAASFALGIIEFSPVLPAGGLLLVLALLSLLPDHGIKNRFRTGLRITSFLFGAFLILSFRFWGQGLMLIPLVGKVIRLIYWPLLRISARINIFELSVLLLGLSAIAAIWTIWSARRPIS